MKRIYYFLCSLSMSLLFTAAAVAQAPINDHCSGAINVTCGTPYSGTIIGATPSPYSFNQNDVWYRLSNASGSVTASLCSGAVNWDSWIRVYRLDAGQPECGTLSIVVQNDDFCGGLSQVNFTASPTAVYYILVTDYGVPANGNYTLTVSCQGQQAPPSNDLCGYATPINCNTSVAGTSLNANPDMGFGSPGVWYVATGTGYPMTAATCGASFASDVHVYTGNCGAQTLVPPTTNIACTNGTSYTWASTLGTTYYILVNGLTSGSGSFSLNLSCYAPPQPSNDYCINAIPVACGNTYSGTTEGATPDSPTGAPDVWYTFVGNGQLVTASLCGSGAYDSYMHVFKLASGSLSCSSGLLGAGSNDDFCGEDAEVTWLAQSGAIYYILVGGAASTDWGAFKLNITCDADGVPNNDNCDGAIPVKCGGDYAGTTQGSTWDSPPGTYGVWYLLKADAAGSYTASLCNGASWDTYLYSAPYVAECGAVNFDMRRDDYCGLQSQLTFTMAAGAQRYILVGGYGGQTGLFTLFITGPCTPEKALAQPYAATKLAGGLTVTVAPNPSAEHAEFNVDASAGGMANLTILNLAGQVVRTQALGEWTPGIHTVREDWGGLAAGIYLYRVQVGEAVANGKLEIMR